MSKLLPIALAAKTFVGTVGTGSAQAGFVTNGDFATGDFTGWTKFTTVNGTIGDGFFYPKVVLFDTQGTGTPVTSAALNVGKAQGSGLPPEEGGGLFQTVTLPAGTFTYSTAIAVSSPSNNAEGASLNCCSTGRLWTVTRLEP